MSTIEIACYEVVLFTCSNRARRTLHPTSATKHHLTPLSIYEDGEGEGGALRGMRAGCGGGWERLQTDEARSVLNICMPAFKGDFDSIHFS